MYLLPLLFSCQHDQLVGFTLTTKEGSKARVRSKGGGGSWARVRLTKRGIFGTGQVKKGGLYCGTYLSGKCSLRQVRETVQTHISYNMTHFSGYHNRIQQGPPKTHRHHLNRSAVDPGSQGTRSYLRRGKTPGIKSQLQNLRHRALQREGILIQDIQIRSR